MIEIQVTREMWEEWTKNPVTKAVMLSVRENVNEVSAHILNNQLPQEKYAKYQGMYIAYANVLNTTFEDTAND